MSTSHPLLIQFRDDSSANHPLFRKHIIHTHTERMEKDGELYYGPSDVTPLPEDVQQGVKVAGGSQPAIAPSVGLLRFILWWGWREMDKNVGVYSIKEKEKSHPGNFEGWSWNGSMLYYVSRKRILFQILITIENVILYILWRSHMYFICYKTSFKGWY